MIPIFIVVKSNGDIWVASNEKDAVAVGGTIHKVNGLPATQKIFTATGCTSVTSTKNGLHTDID